MNAVQQPQQLTLPAPAQLDATPALQIAAGTVPRNSNSIVRALDMNMITNLNKEELMIDSGAATHVCPFWFASTHPNGFEAKLRAKEGTYFLPVNNTGTPPNYKLDVHETQQGIKATISPITLTPGGTQSVTHQHDIWTYNGRTIAHNKMEPQKTLWKSFTTLTIANKRESST